MPGAVLVREPGAERISTRQSIHREQENCDQNLAFSLLEECFFLRSDHEGTLGLNTVFMPHGGSEKPGKREVGGASRDSTGLGALEEGLISS